MFPLSFVDGRFEKPVDSNLGLSLEAVRCAKPTFYSSSSKDSNFVSFKYFAFGTAELEPPPSVLFLLL